VGSQFLAANPELGVRSATIRNELAEMTDLGYLRQPHTSAGRIPSDMGYRYYVDHLMAWDRLSATDARAIRGAQKVNEGDLEQLLMQTCRVLSSLTRYTSMATPPTSEEPSVRQVHLAQVSPQMLLAVVVLDNGQVVHRFAELPRAQNPGEVTQLGNELDALVREVPIRRLAQVAPPESAQPGRVELLRLLLGVISRGAAEEEADLFLEGASRILEQPEFRESNRVEPLVRFLEERKSAYETLRRILAEQSLAVSIGQENPHESMHEVSVVAARYDAGGRRGGWVGVLGPTRMHYEQVVPAVQYAARALSASSSRLAGA
jgi:heat-inducible transcriptional repressor